MPRLEEEANGCWVCLQVKFERITRPWHCQLGVDVRSLVLVLEVKLVATNELKIMCDNIFEGDETAVLMW